MFSSTCIRSWLIAWILAAPAFHIHTLDAQENHFLSKAAFAHTVFSQDLPGEYVTRTAVHGNGQSDQLHVITNHILRYSEIGFGLFNEDDSKRRNGFQFIVLALHAELEIPLFESVQQASIPATSHTAGLPRVSGPTRAPPSVSC